MFSVAEFGRQAWVMKGSPTLELISEEVFVTQWVMDSRLHWLHRTGATNVFWVDNFVEAGHEKTRCF